MASYLLLAAIVQAILLQTAYSQCVNRVVPTCAQNLPLETFLPIEAFLSNQLLVNPGLPLALPALPNVPYQLAPSLAAEAVYTPTVIQDSTVANNLANTLQLLVVSNLLSATLPGNGYDVIEPCVPVGSYGPYGYVY